MFEHATYAGTAAAHQNPAPFTTSHRESHPARWYEGDWFAQLGATQPQLAAEAEALGVSDEESYLATEAGLPLKLRIALGWERLRSRTEGGVLNARNVMELLAFAPPWLFEVPVATLGLGARPQHAFEQRGIRVIGDLLAFGTLAIRCMPKLGRMSSEEVAEKILGALKRGPMPACALAYLNRGQQSAADKAVAGPNYSI